MQPAPHHDPDSTASILHGAIRVRPSFLFVVTLVGISGAEVAIMLQLGRLAPMPAPWEALLDGFLLLIVIFPLLYVLVFCPMYRLIDEYRRALAEIRTLQGVIPICSECKKIRTGATSWEQLDGYISSRSEASFSRGVCDDCIRRLYPEKADRILAQMGAVGRGQEESS
jgi:Zn-finger protein